MGRDNFCPEEDQAWRLLLLQVGLSAGHGCWRLWSQPRPSHVCLAHWHICLVAGGRAGRATSPALLCAAWRLCWEGGCAGAAAQLCAPEAVPDQASGTVGWPCHRCPHPGQLVGLALPWEWAWGEAALWAQELELARENSSAASSLPRPLPSALVTGLVHAPHPFELASWVWMAHPIGLDRSVFLYPAFGHRRAPPSSDLAQSFWPP